MFGARLNRSFLRPGGQFRGQFSGIRARRGSGAAQNWPVTPQHWPCRPRDRPVGRRIASKLQDFLWLCPLFRLPC
eukprot:15434976-Alexandrium_andersonii.AAC.1